MANLPDFFPSQRVTKTSRCQVILMTRFLCPETAAKHGCQKRMTDLQGASELCGLFATNAALLWLPSFSTVNPTECPCPCCEAEVVRVDSSVALRSESNSTVTTRLTSSGNQSNQMSSPIVAVTTLLFSRIPRLAIFQPTATSMRLKTFPAPRVLLPHLAAHLAQHCRQCLFLSTHGVPCLCLHRHLPSARLAAVPGLETARSVEGTLGSSSMAVTGINTQYPLLVSLPVRLGDSDAGGG